VGKIYKVLIDRKEGEYLVGRTQYDSPEVDNEILLPDNGSMKTGEFYQVRITSAEAFDLYGKVEEPTL
jgi:ribosomal protein S12 methylthiotransferase